MGSRLGAVLGGVLLIGGCAWWPGSAPAPASVPVIEHVEVVTAPVVEMRDDGSRDPRPAPTAVWDGRQQAWTYDVAELRIGVSEADVAGYAFGRDGQIFSVHSGDLGRELSVMLHDSDLVPGDVVEVHAFREDVPGFPHEPGTLRAAGLSPPHEVVVPPY